MKKLVLAMSLSAICGAAQAAHWGYEGEHGPEHWGNVSKICEQGLNQSPINLTSMVDAKLSPLDISYSGTVTALTNNGHSLQATVEGANTLTIDGIDFELKQFHFHTPSENTIDNQYFPLEGHFVHADKDGNLAVISVMFKMGEQNQQLASLTETLPAKDKTVALKHPFAVKDMLPSYSAYYRFNGSLTTPPCSEGVRWIVLKDVKVLSEQQEQALSDVMGENNRPVQATNARVVLSSN